MTITKISKGLLFIFLAIIVLNPFFTVKASDAEVTNRELLIMSSLSYCDKIYKNDIAKMIESRVLNRNLKKDMLDPNELNGWEIFDYEINKEEKESFSVFVFKKGNNVVIVPRGTDNGVFHENYKYLVPGSEHPQAKYLVEYLKNLVKKLSNSDFSIDPNLKIYLVGHSLGGYLALYGAGVLLQIPKVRYHVVKVLTLNGLGLGYFTNKNILDQLRNREFCKIENYRINGDVVSIIGYHITKCVTLQSTNLIETVKSFWYRLVNANSHQIIQFYYTKPFMKAEKDISKENSNENVEIKNNKTLENSLSQESTKDSSTIDEKFNRRAYNYAVSLFRSIKSTAA